MEANPHYKSTQVIIHKLEKQLQDISKLQLKQGFEEKQREIEEHFERAIHALEARQQELISQLHLLSQKQDATLNDIKDSLRDRLNTCKDMVQTGVNVFKHNKLSADMIWQEALKLEGESINTTTLQVQVTVELPYELLTNIITHGKVIDAAQLPFNSAVPAPMPAVSGNNLQKLQTSTNVHQIARSYLKAESVTTLAGGGGYGNLDGMKNAKLNFPYGICYNPLDQCLYVADSRNRSIRQITMEGEVSTLHKSDTLRPYGIAINKKENAIYIANDEHTITKLSLTGASKGILSVVAGSKQSGDKDGTGPNATFRNPMGIAVDEQRGDIYVCDRINHKIRKITSAGVVSTLAGSEKGFADGYKNKAKFNCPYYLTFVEEDQALIVTDCENSKLRKVTLDGAVTTLCDIPLPLGIAMAPDRTIIVSSGSHQLFAVKQNGPSYEVSVLAGMGKGGNIDGIPSESSFRYPYGIAISEQFNVCFVVDNDNHSIRKITFGN